jgi:predicted RNA-binding protein YlqC (UPF0109 family)
MHLAGFIIKKFVTMHGHMKVKYFFTWNFLKLHILQETEEAGKPIKKTYKTFIFTRTMNIKNVEGVRELKN